MRETAWLCLIVDGVNSAVPYVTGAQTFGEPSPTMTRGGMRYVPYLVGRGTDYSEGLKDIAEQLEHPENKWIVDLINERK